MEWNYILRIFIAGLLGGLIGFEREIRAKEAGVRTHFIVALGSALFMIISQYAFQGQYDHARVAAQVVSGIGFIGAGVIIFQKNAEVHRSPISLAFIKRSDFSKSAKAFCFARTAEALFSGISSTSCAAAK